VGGIYCIIGVAACRVRAREMRVRLLLLFLAAWLVLLLVLVASSFFQQPQGSNAGRDGASSPIDEAQLAKRLAHAFRDLDLLKRQNAELRILFGDVAIRYCFNYITLYAFSNELHN
jgi:hypothetical protein